MGETMIRKNAFFYWGDRRQFSYLHYLTIYSFIKLNPKWKVSVYTSRKLSKTNPWKNRTHLIEYDKDSYFDKLQDLNVNIIKFDFRDIDVDPETPEVFKSDFINMLRTW